MKVTFLRINSNFTPRFELEEPLTIMGERIERVYNDGTLYYQLMSSEGVTFIKYGFDGNDQWWSSNGSYISSQFGLKVRECTIRELYGDYPGSWFSMGILKECIPVPECLEWREHWGSECLLPKKGIEFPRGDDYFSSTVLDDEGNLLYPKPNVEVQTSDIIQYSQKIEEELNKDQSQDDQYWDQTV